MFEICFLLIVGLKFTHGQEECGVPQPGFFESEMRIIGGQATTPNVSPWQLAIETDDGSQFDLHCGGAVLSPNWGITAAHCVTPRPGGEQLMAIAGMYNRTEEFVNTQIRLLNTEHITLHPDFNETTLENDLALLHFLTALDLSTPRVKAICLPADSDTSYIENPNCFITGWGMTAFEGEYSNALMRISIDLVGAVQCELRFPRPLMPSETCTFDEVSWSDTPCHGDMGGPLGCAYNAKFYLAGVGSFTDPECDPRVPQIYTNIPYHIDWIRNITGILPVSQ